MNCHPSEYKYRTEERIVEEISVTGIFHGFPFSSIHFKSKEQTNPLWSSSKCVCLFHNVLLLTGFIFVFLWLSSVVRSKIHTRFSRCMFVFAMCLPVQHHGDVPLDLTHVLCVSSLCMFVLLSNSLSKCLI